MLEIFVDADACPVKDEVVKVAERHSLTVHMVANTWMRLDDSPLVKRVVVADGPDQADDWIVENCGAGDIVVTADIPLAGRCLEKEARVIGPTGRPFTVDSIGMALAMRELNQELRETGVIGGGGPSFSKQDRSRFLQSLHNAIMGVKRTND